MCDSVECPSGQADSLPLSGLEHPVNRSIEQVIRVIGHRLHGKSQDDVEDLLLGVAHREERLDVTAGRPSAFEEQVLRKATPRMNPGAF